MAEPIRTIVTLVPNPALSSILTATLASEPRLRVRAFDSATGLFAYLRLAQAEAVIVDVEGSDADVPWQGVAAIRSGGTRLIALVGNTVAQDRIAALRTRVDEVIVKPMSPKYLLERVTLGFGGRKSASISLAAGSTPRRGLTHGDWSRFGDNVVPLFKAQAEPRP